MKNIQALSAAFYFLTGIFKKDQLLDYKGIVSYLQSSQLTSWPFAGHSSKRQGILAGFPVAIGL
ncbi:hypothetical protein [Pedobacter sp. NJ-S-72]